MQTKQNLKFGDINTSNQTSSRDLNVFKQNKINNLFLMQASVVPVITSSVIWQRVDCHTNLIARRPWAGRSPARRRRRRRGGPRRGHSGARSSHYSQVITRGALAAVVRAGRAAAGGGLTAEAGARGAPALPAPRGLACVGLRNSTWRSPPTHPRPYRDPVVIIMLKKRMC